MPKGDHRRTSFLHPYPVYAEQYGVSEQTIGRMKREGVDLDDPSKVEERLRKEPRARVRSKHPFKVASDQHGTNGDEPARAVLHGVEAIRATAEDLGRRCNAARDAGDTATELRLLRPWMAVQKELRESEKAMSELALLRGDVVKAEKVTAFHATIFSAIREAQASLPQRAAHKLIGKDLVGMVEVLKNENEEVFKNIRPLPTRLSEL